MEHQILRRLVRLIALALLAPIIVIGIEAPA